MHSPLLKFSECAMIHSNKDERALPNIPEYICMRGKIKRNKCGDACVSGGENLDRRDKGFARYSQV